ncbi:MAG: hypothetical protein M3463_19825 [Verrucomicrobiota bacterium]|nr:hypothetical protein [Verrucomicrobiota bacterium]
MRAYSQSRQILRTYGRVGERIEGTKGVLDTSGTSFTIKGANPWRFPRSDKRTDAFQFEHNDLFAAIRAGRPYEEAEYSAISTMTAIMGRMATYSGKLIEWEDALSSSLDLGPKSMAWDAVPPIVPDADGNYPVAMPGRTTVL